MEMVSVESSNIAKIGHEGTNLRVEFRDGKVYEWPEISPELHTALLAAESKGRFIARHIGKGVPISSNDEAQVLQIGVLQTADNDLCCSPPLHRAMLDGKLDAADVWDCPRCGGSWRCEQIGNTLRHWSPVPMIAVF